MKPANLDALLTGAQAARVIGTDPQRIYSWVSRGNLEPAVGDDVPAGKKRYRYRDVLAADAATREAVRENGGRRRAIRFRAA